MVVANKAPNKPTKPADAPVTEKPKKEKVKRVLWGDRDEKGKLKEKLTSPDVPSSFDPKTNLPLRRSDFANPADALDFQASRLEAKAASLRKKAVEERTLGNSSERAKAKKMKSLFEKFKKMETELKASGMNDEQIAAFMAE